MEPKTLGRPRIHITARAVGELKSRAKTTHAFYYGKLVEAADEAAAQKLPDTFGGTVDNRRFGDVLPVLSMAHLVSGEAKYAEAARAICRRLVATEKWGDDLDLVTGHFLSGAAIAYDWLYEYLPQAEREALAKKIAHHAGILYANASEQRVWWHDYFLHNWNHVITGSLGYAAAALAGENADAGKWSDYAEGLFTAVEKALPEDGSYQEGFAYMTYAWECIVRYFDLARQLYGRDHYGAKWLREAPYLLMHFSTPRIAAGDNCMMFGDGPRHFEWHGPVHLLNRSAEEYADGAVQGFANALADAGVGLSRGGTWLNMLWYNPAIKAKGHAGLPTARRFADLDVASMRSGWDPDAVMVGFKCTNNAGRKTTREYPGRDLGSGHAHPDAASFQIYAFGQWLAVDTGYTHYKQSPDHNTIAVNGVGQLGGERIWYDMMECFSNGGTAEITHFETTDGYDYARGDASRMYRPKARLVKFVRHVVFIKPADILVVDELASEAPSRFEWRMHADEEIAEAGGAYEVKKGDARLRVVFLAPEGLAARVRKVAIEGQGTAGMREAVVLSAAPKKRTRAVRIVTFMSAYRGAAGETEARLVEMDESACRVEVRRGGKARTLTILLAEGKVTLA